MPANQHSFTRRIYGPCTATRHRCSERGWYEDRCRCPATYAHVRKLWAARQIRRKERARTERAWMDPIIRECFHDRYPQPERLGRRLTIEQRRVLVAEGTRTGMSAREISERLGVTERSVIRIRGRIRALSSL